ncbi:hypothetical protein OHW20_02450 [Acinetobacter baumannii]|nr:hypothetical protein [Acinetobacter baumannii]
MTNRKKALEDLKKLTDEAILQVTTQKNGLKNSIIDFPDKGKLITLLGSCERILINTKRSISFFSYELLKKLKQQINDLLYLFPIDFQSTDYISKIPDLMKKIDSYLHYIEIHNDEELKNFNFEPIDNDDFQKLLDITENDFMQSMVDYPTDFNSIALNVYTHELTDRSTKDTIVNTLINIHNQYRATRKPSIETIKDLYITLRNEELELNKAEFSSQVKEHNDEYKEVRKKLGLQENKSLILAYQSEADKYKSSISNYTYSIIFIFAIISATILLNIILFNKNYDWHKYVFFATFIFSLSGLLAFLIKERSRLVSLQTYCIKNHLELTSLPEYLADLNEEQSQNLRVDLAKSYFKGYEENQKSDSNDKSMGQLTSNLDQVVKSISEIKNLISK